MFTRATVETYVDADPVQARAASFGKVQPVADAFPWNDRLVETLPDFVGSAVTPAAKAPDLSADLIDSDPLAARGWR